MADPRVARCRIFAAPLVFVMSTNNRVSRRVRQDRHPPRQRVVRALLRSSPQQSRRRGVRHLSSDSGRSETPPARFALHRSMPRRPATPSQGHISTTTTRLGSEQNRHDDRYGDDRRRPPAVIAISSGSDRSYRSPDVPIRSGWAMRSTSMFWAVGARVEPSECLGQVGAKSLKLGAPCSRSTPAALAV